MRQELGITVSYRESLEAIQGLEKPSRASGGAGEVRQDGMWNYVLAWIPMVFIAIANGILRQASYGRHLSELRAHQLSTAVGIVLFGIYIGFVMRLLPPGSARAALIIGLTWLALTVAFEFLFGHYVAKHPWKRLLHDYNMRAGRLWPLVLIWITIAPSLFYHLQR